MHQIVHKSEKLPPTPYIDLGLELILFKNGAKQKQIIYLCISLFAWDTPEKSIRVSAASVSVSSYGQIFLLYTFFYKQSIFDPRPENCLSFSKKSTQKIV